MLYASIEFQNVGILVVEFYFENNNFKSITVQLYFSYFTCIILIDK